MTESPDADYRLAVVDLLGAIAYGELSAFERLVDDAKLAPDPRATRSRWRRWPACRVRPRRPAARAAPRARRRPVRGDGAVRVGRSTSSTRHTAPADWYEGLIKAYVGDGLAADFYREIAAYLDADTRDLIIASLEDTGQADFAVERVRQAIADDPQLGGRLALWGRRLMGEALTQAQRVAAERDALTALLAGGIDRPGPRPRRDRPDVHPDHRAARRADGRARPRRLSADPRDASRRS